MSNEDYSSLDTSQLIAEAKSTLHPKNASKARMELSVRFARTLSNFARRKFPNMTATGLAHEAVEKVLMSNLPQNLSTRDQVRAALFRKIQCLGIDRLRKESRRKEIPLSQLTEIDSLGEIAPSSHSPIEALLDAEMANLITAALAELDPLEQDLIDLYFFQEMSYREVARFTDKAESVVRTRIKRILDKLRPSEELCDDHG